MLLKIKLSQHAAQLLRLAEHWGLGPAWKQLAVWLSQPLDAEDSCPCCWGAFTDELHLLIFDISLGCFKIFPSFSILPRNEIQPQQPKQYVGDRLEVSSSRWAWQRFGEQLWTTLRGFLVMVNLLTKLEHYTCDWARCFNLSLPWFTSNSEHRRIKVRPIQAGL